MRTFLLAGFLCLTGLDSARAESFVTKGGARFEGSILSATTDYFAVSVQGRVLDIRRDSIRSIDFEPDWDGRSLRLGERTLKAGVGGALPLPAYGFKRVANGGLATDIEFSVHTSPQRDLGLRVDDLGFATAYPQSATLNGKADVQGTTLLIEGRWLPWPRRRVSPFLVGGLGLNLYSEEIELTPKPGVVWSDTHTSEMREIENTSLGPAALLGGGLQVLLSRNYLADFEACWHYWRISGPTFGNPLQSGDYVQAVSLLARLGWRF